MDKKQEAIELLKKETTDLANVYKKDGGFVLSGTYNNEKEETYNNEQREIKEIRVGDYFIARRPKQDAVLGWISMMDKFDGVIQECGFINEIGCIFSKTTFMGMWCYLPEWCEKVYPGDVMKTGYGDLIIFKEFKNGKMYDYAFCSHDDGEIYIDQEVPIFSQPQLHISHTTPEEAKPLFDALAKRGKKWNKEKLQIEDISKPKTSEETLRALGYSIEEAKDFKAYREKYDIAVEELQNTSKEYMASVKEAIVELKSDNRPEYLKTMADLYAASSQSGKRDALKQVIKLCKQLLNEK